MSALAQKQTCAMQKQMSAKGHADAGVPISMSASAHCEHSELHCHGQIGFVTGGVSDAKHAPDVLSLGSVYNEPFWIFYSSNEQLDRLSQLKGKRIAVGPVESATRHTAEQISWQGRHKF
jgi:hypothetical protein